MNERFIAVSSDGCGYGHWGVGDTVEEAKAKLKKLGAKAKEVKACRVMRFVSELPFAPITKKVADKNEADCWVGRDGSVNWVRCEREELVAV